MLVFKGLGRTDGSLLIYFNRVWLGRDPDTLGVAEGGGAWAQVCTGHPPTYESVILKTPLTACSLNTICAPLETYTQQKGRRDRESEKTNQTRFLLFLSGSKLPATIPECSGLLLLD